MANMMQDNAQELLSERLQSKFYIAWVRAYIIRTRGETPQDFSYLRLGFCIAN